MTEQNNKMEQCIEERTREFNQKLDDGINNTLTKTADSLAKTADKLQKTSDCIKSKNATTLREDFSIS